MSSSEKKAAIILAAITGLEGAWLYVNMAGRTMRFFRATGFVDPERAGLLGWALALVTVAFFVWRAAQLPSVRENLFRPSFLKLLAICVAVAAGFCEEVIFRKWLMDLLQERGFHVLIQILVSALVFGLAHGIWGLFGRSFRAAAGATIATAILGAMLAIVYVAARRVIAPCIVAHFLINLLIEPGLVLAAVRKEMGKAAA